MSGLDEKYKGVQESVARELAEDEIKYFREDLPVPFCGMNIYPAKVREYERFMDATSCLTLDKNISADGVGKTNLEFLISKTQVPDQKEAAMWSYRINSLLEICFHEKNGYKCPQCGHFVEIDSDEYNTLVQKKNEELQSLIVQHPELFADTGKVKEILKGLASMKCPVCAEKESDPLKVPTLYAMFVIRQNEAGKLELVIDNKNVISSKDFNRFRYIVLFQNFPDYRDESWVDPALRADHQAKLEIESKRNNLHASLERKVVALSINSNYKISEIYDMPIRKFTLALSLVNELIDYKIMKTAATSGFVKLEKGQKIEHWLYKDDKDMYGDYKSLDSVTSAMGKV